MDDISSQKKKTKTRVDGTMQNEKYRMRIRYSLDDAQSMLEGHRRGSSSSTLLSRGKRTRTFFTSDSHRYITPLEQDALALGMRRSERLSGFDSVQVRYSRPTQTASDTLYRRLQAEYSGLANTLARLPDMLAMHISPMRMVNASIVGAIFFGMFSMTLIYRYLGQQVSAENTALVADAPVVGDKSPFPEKSAVLGASTESLDSKESKPAAAVAIPSSPIPPKDLKKDAFAAEVTEMVKGYPIEAMLPYILKQDRQVAVFLIAIGKKESNWGKRVPVLNGEDCYNYWGYRGIRDRMGTGGHTCFDSPEDAVNTVAKRIKTLVEEKKLDTPAKMIVWKCGSSCAGHSPEGVRKWISDVDGYFQELK